jgi:glycosyltransferase involved in cell wall biosynthesis
MVEVSVIVPAYNAGHSLLRALRSVSSQSLRNIEILVVDDASQDQTHEIARSAVSTDPRVRVIRRPTNGGPSAARNTGIDVARGTWIALLDADDLYMPERLAILTDAARSADCDLLADNITLRSAESGRCLGLAIPPVLANQRRLLTSADFARNDRPFPGGFSQLGYVMPLIRREFLDSHNIRYDTDIWCAEDFVFYMRCLLAGARMMLLPEAYYEYTLLPDSISRAEANLTRNFEHLERGNARVIAEARQRGNRSTFVQLKRRGKNIAFLRAYYGYKHAARRCQWSEALVHLLKMPLAPIELAQLLRLHVHRRISRANGAGQLTECSDQMRKEACS